MDSQITKKPGTEEMARIVAEYMISTRCTVRRAAKEFGLSKTTIHKYVTVILSQSMQLDLYHQVQEVISWNKSQRSIRGGAATRQKKALWGK